MNPNDVVGMQPHMQDMSLHDPARGYGRKKTHRAMHTDLAGENQASTDPYTQYQPDGRQQQSTDQFYSPSQPQQARQIYNSQQSHAPKTYNAVHGTGDNKVNPEQIPSVPEARDANQETFRHLMYPTMERILPPLASTDYVAVDQNMSSPKFARLTTCNVPVTADLLDATRIPLGLILQPLASQRPEEMPVPVIDFGDMGPPRCRRCRAYINPFMGFAEGGQKFVCNMCMFGNEVDSSYYAPIGPMGRRVDIEQRPELLFGTCDFLVPKEYWSKPPVPIHILFLIDVSNDAINKSVPMAACEAIRSTLYDDDEKKLPHGGKIAIATLDRSVHFYNLHEDLDHAQMLVVSDLDEMFVPLQEGLFVDPVRSRGVVEKLLDSIHNMFSGIKVAEAAIGPALQGALLSLQATGGKACLFTSSLTSIGPGKLPMREDGKAYNTEREKSLYAVEHLHYKTLAEKFVEAGVGLDLFLFPAAYIDVASIGHVSSLSGGETYLYPNFVYDRDLAKVAGEVLHCCTRETGTQGVMKIRCSNGLQTTDHYGNFLQRNSAADLEFGSVDEDKAVAVVFKHDGTLDEKLDAHFQSALLYTTATGQRRVRVHNMVAAVTKNVRDTFRVADQDAIITVLAKSAASKITEKPLKEIRDAVVERSVQILAAYRHHCASSSPPGQLILPEALKELSMLSLGIIKSRAFRGTQMVSDIRIHAVRLIKSMGAPEMTWYLYPRMLPLHSLEPTDGFADERGMLRLPGSARLTFAKIENGGAYLVDNGQMCILWLPSNVSPNLLKDLFGDDKESLDQLDPYMNRLPQLETTLNVQVRNILSYLASIRGSKSLSVQLARQGMDGAEYEFAGALVEDRNNDAASYVDHLCNLHRLIQVAGHKSKGNEFGGLRPMLNY